MPEVSCCLELPGKKTEQEKNERFTKTRQRSGNLNLRKKELIYPSLQTVSIELKK